METSSSGALHAPVVSLVPVFAGMTKRGCVTAEFLSPFGAAHHADDSGASDFDQPQLTHERDEAVDLLAGSGEFEHEAFGARVDDLGAEHVSDAERFDPVLAFA